VYFWLSHFCWRLLLRRVPNFLDELFELLALAGAHVEEADAYGVAIVNGLNYSAEAEGQAFNAELGFDARVDAHREAVVAADAAAADADIDDAAYEPRTYLDEDDGGGVVDGEPGVGATFRRRRVQIK
jgi:hypothetical protein